MGKKPKKKSVAFDDVEFPFMTTLARGYYKTAKSAANKKLIGFIPAAGGPVVQPEHIQHIKFDPERLATHFTIGVNLAFSLEVYLKAINLILDNKLGQEHNLLEIYEKLPQEVMLELESIHSRLKINSSQIDVSEAISRHNRIDNFPDEKQPETFRDVVESASHMFVNWRYIYEIEVSKKYLGDTFFLHYRQMKRACIAARKFIRIRKFKLRKIISGNLPGTKNSYPLQTCGIKSFTRTRLDSTDSHKLLFFS